ncbi:L-histidine N(alpha)-methyltransferase [Hyphomicrobium sp.]|jgi:dimethylhistidine N-methyltransferase|uniref:L-histidine N(alpha)-methyltransferase n=1 Tax=Hyphomicrobium sp. TaxID=82 RepID=UPI0035618862
MRYVPTLERLPADVSKVDSEFSISVIEGLSRAQKELPCRYFYDARGSALFEEITRLPEYYPTRTEAQILRGCASDLVEDFRDGDLFIEFGSGSSLKTQILLDRVAARIVYVPVDVSETALADAVMRLAVRYPGLEVRPLVADFSRLTALPRDLASRRAVGFFPGSTIGNLAPREAEILLSSFRRVLGKDGRLIIGVDLKKDQQTLTRAYDDAAGVTAAFNMNLLSRINRELGGTFDERAFVHKAIYNSEQGRIEMHLVSEREQDVRVCGRIFHFRKGESIHTENSYKYKVAEFRDLATRAGWQAERVWTDANNLFSVHELA